MSLPTSQKQWVVTTLDKGFDGLEYQDAPLPKVGENEVLVKMRAASLNYRDLLIPQVTTRLSSNPYPSIT
jgi:NADPH:quinone reductase-like Zn-dependent oxidoreductase